LINRQEAMERYRIADDVGIHFVTMSVVNWLPVFVSDGAFRIVADSFNFCHERKGLRVNAYVVMPTHLHAIVFLRQFDPKALKDTLIDFRKYTGRRLIEYCRQHMPHCFDSVFVESAGADRERRFWRAGFHPERIETEAFYVQKLDFLHDNPRRKGLVTRAEYWRFSSASYWLSDGKLVNDVVLSQLEW
jgi:putative transposase